MGDSIIYLDRSRIHSDDLAGLRAAVTDLVAYIQQEEPQLQLYGFEIDEAARAMTVVAVHPDSESLERHLGIGGPGFRKVGAYIELQSIDVYGVPSDAVLEQLHAKGRALGGNVSVTVHPLASSFSRLRPTPT